MKGGGIGGGHLGLVRDEAVSAGADPGDEDAERVEPRDPAPLGPDPRLDAVLGVQAEMDRRVADLETAAAQLLGQQSQVEAACMQYRDMINTHTARLDALARALAQNWRLAAVNAAVQAKTPGMTADQIMKLAREFAKFIEQPPLLPVTPVTPPADDETRH